MTYVVTAPLVVALGPDGRVHHCYTGSQVEFGDESHAEYLLSEGLIQRSGKPTGDDVAAPESSDKPPFVASKAKWVEYAVAQGFSESDAESMTKSQLIAALK